jgi:hypothetical protein
MEFVYVLSFGIAADRRPAGTDSIRIAKTEATRCIPGEHTIIRMTLIIIERQFATAIWQFAGAPNLHPDSIPPGTSDKDLA